MIVFDSNNAGKWSGRGFAINGNSIVAYKNADFKHPVILRSGNYSFKIFAKNRTGNSNLSYKILSERNVVLSAGKISLTKNWTEENISFNIPKNYGNGFIHFFREKTGFGSSELGRVVLDLEEVIKNQRPARTSKRKELNFDDIVLPDVKKTIKNKIAFVIPYTIYGGAEVYLETLINNLDPNIFQIHIVYMKDNPLRFSVANKTLIHKKCSSTQNFVNYISNQPLDYVVYYNSIQVYKLIKSAFSNVIKKPKLIEIYHSDFRWSDSLSTLKERDGVDIAFKVAPKYLEGVSGIRKTEHLPVPIDISRFCIRDIDATKELKINVPANKKVIGTVARLSKEKNIDYVLDVAKSTDDFIFLIFGEGPEEQKIRTRISEEGIDNVHLVGFKKDIFRYYGALDGFMLPSKMEGTPISILEAMASGVPVFVSNVGQVSSIVLNGKTGFFLTMNPKEDVELMKRNLFNNNVVLSAREYIEKVHSHKVIAAKFINSILDEQNQFTKKKTIKILPGEYI